MTEPAFFQWQANQAERSEFVKVQPRARIAARFGHDRTLFNALGSLLAELETINSPCRPFTADIAVRVPTGNLRRPDVAVHCPPYDEDAMVSDRLRW